VQGSYKNVFDASDTIAAFIESYRYGRKI